MSSNTQVFPDNVLKPDGSDTVFTKGTYRGRSFYDVLVEDPRQFTILRNAKNLSKELHSFVTWADQHFNVNNDGVIEEKADWVTVPCIGVCTDVRHKGSSAGFIRATCKKCGTATQVERNKPFLDPEVCPHANVDHRGSSRKRARLSVATAACTLMLSPENCTSTLKESDKHWSMPAMMRLRC